MTVTFPGWLGTTHRGHHRALNIPGVRGSGPERDGPFPNSRRLTARVSDWVMIRGEPAMGAIDRATHSYSVDPLRIRTMMQSCASAAELRDGRPIL
jgi:hypothetical protein